MLCQQLRLGLQIRNTALPSRKALSLGFSKKIFEEQVLPHIREQSQIVTVDAN